ncbi:MAG: hypothetical protein HDT23_03780 [Ruminococcus sp.]|nr:hypothetical protein [Ruminococcus sp.]
MKITTCCRLTLEVSAENMALAEKITKMINIIIPGQEMTVEAVADLAVYGIFFADTDGNQGMNRKLAGNLEKEVKIAENRLISAGMADKIPAPEQAEAKEITVLCDYIVEISMENFVLAKETADAEWEILGNPSSLSLVLDREISRTGVKSTDTQEEINRKLTEILRKKLEETLKKS